MSVLIAYRSKYGATADCARALAARIPVQTKLADLARDRRPDVAAADVVLIGGSIYGGKIQREVPAFCDRQRELLLARPVGLFICCLYRDEHAMAQLSSAFPDWLLAHAFARSWLGGEIHRDRLTLFDRVLIRSLPQSIHDIATVRREAIEELAAAVNALGR